MKSWIFILFISFCGLSCTSFKVRQVTASNRDSVQGLRFFMPQPFLLVAEKDLLVDGVKKIKQAGEETTTTTEKMAVARKELHCSIIYLPDPQQEYAISTFTGKTPKSIKLVDGWRLTAFNLKEENLISPQQMGLLSGTKGLAPGIYSIHNKDGLPCLQRVEIIQ